MDTLVLAQGGGTDFVAPITGAVSGMAGDMMLVGAAGLVVGVAILGLRKGFKFFKGMF